VRRDNRSIDVLTIAQFINTIGCRRGVISGYLDRKRVEYSNIEAVRCNRCGEGRAEWTEANSRWAREWEDMQKVMDKLVEVYVVCCVLGPTNDEVWASHWIRDCKAHTGLTGSKLDAFRGYIRYDKDSYSYIKYRIS
jgi:DNA-directed RNA polymerase subunit N (RpoN/RPB10)